MSIDEKATKGTRQGIMIAAIASILGVNSQRRLFSITRSSDRKLRISLFPLRCPMNPTLGTSRSVTISACTRA